MKKALVIFIKNAEEGKVKTRLAATVGNAKALSVYRYLLSFTKKITVGIDAQKFVYYSSFIEREDDWTSPPFIKRVQTGDGLGERMKNAFKKLFDEACQNICIIGSDCPSLSESIIQNAFEALTDNEVVIGPAYDGGYYLLGMKNPNLFLFENIQWNTATVFIETIAICRHNNLSFFLLPLLHDVDEERDLVHLKSTQRSTG